jgi:hypothetical protein
MATALSVLRKAVETINASGIKGLKPVTLSEFDAKSLSIHVEFERSENVRCSFEAGFHFRAVTGTLSVRITLNTASVFPESASIQEYAELISEVSALCKKLEAEMHAEPVTLE